jgi:adenine-specific DNA-methyltransferase
MKLNQHFTPTWAAELLLQRYFPALSATDTVWEPTCGDGRFLLAVPASIPAFGTEVDPVQAQAARENTGRQVITGDCLSVDLPARPTAVVGNPPFQADLVQALLDRCHYELAEGERVGLLLPVYLFQTAATVVRYHHRWSIRQELVPRNLFEGLTKPLLFALFQKEQHRSLHGFFLYAETDAVLAGVHPRLRAYLLGNLSTALCWRDAVRVALEACGGQASLSQLYACFEAGGRPTTNKFWREKIRQVAGKHFVRTAPGEYALQEAA